MDNGERVPDAAAHEPSLGPGSPSNPAVHQPCGKPRRRGLPGLGRTALGILVAALVLPAAPALAQAPPAPSNGEPNNAPTELESRLIWEATMTAAPLYTDYGYSDFTGFRHGSLTESSFDIEGVPYTVNVIEAGGWLYIGFDTRMPEEFILEVDGVRLSSADATMQIYTYSNLYRWDDADVTWSDGASAQLKLYRGDSDAGEKECPGRGTAAGGEDVGVTAVPIIVTSTTADYFVLYVVHDFDGTAVEQPVLVKLGEAGTTTLAENVTMLAKERYRVEKYAVDNPADVDGDCVDDITELNSLGSMNPVNPAPRIYRNDGLVALVDTETFDEFSNTSADRHHLKLMVFGMDIDRPGFYIVNHGTHPFHQRFANALSLYDHELTADATRVELYYNSGLVAADGSEGLFYLEFSDYRRAVSFSDAVRAYALLAASAPLISNNLALYFRDDQIPFMQPELELFHASRIPLLFRDDIYGESSFEALNPGQGYGVLRSLDPDDRPGWRDVVIYEELPNDLPRVAGVISTVPQTPLSHVNLRAVQNAIPNAYIKDALDDADIVALVDSWVYVDVGESGYTIRAATKAEVDAQFEASRPSRMQTPQRDLTVTGIAALSDIGFDDWDAFGVKAANLAELRKLDFPEGTVPDGFAIPFYFYDEFMKANELYDDVSEMLSDESFQADFEEQQDQLKDLRKAIKDAESPQWIIDALTDMHAQFPVGTSLRYRSSTNNEDLPNFNGAGLYDSKTQKPDETEEDGIDKSLKQVFAGLWTFRAFTEREFHRIDHKKAAMGVLVHPNFTDELANGVAVSFDPIADEDDAGRYDRYYVNTQVGEDLVTNPDVDSVPEEMLLGEGLNGDKNYRLLSTSNQVDAGEILMSDGQINQLREHLGDIHDHFRRLYDPSRGEDFAIEIEFKITEDDVLSIKQARPWVFYGPGGPAGVASARMDSSGPYRTGDIVAVEVTWASNVIVDTAGGTPTVKVSVAGNERTAVYVGGSGTPTLRFEHIVEAADDGATWAGAVPASLDLAGGTITSRGIAALTNFIVDGDVATDPEEPAITTTSNPSPYEENATGAVHTFEARDPQGGPVTWTVTGIDSEAFEIDPSGVLTFRNSPDFESPSDAGHDNDYQITVVATDDQSLTDGVEVTVTVTDVDEAPVVSGPQSLSLTQDELTDPVLATYTATDPEDPDAVISQWGLSGSDAGDFTVSESGELSFRNVPPLQWPEDPGGDNVYEFSVWASDGRNDGYLPVVVTVVEVAPSPVWSATLTVGADRSRTPASFGYSLWGLAGDELSPDRFTLDGSQVRVLVLGGGEAGLFLGLGSEVGVDFTLVVGDVQLRSQDSGVPVGKPRGRYWWPAPELGWTEGDAIEVQLIPEAGTGEPAARPPAALVAWFRLVPEDHNGTDAFTLRASFTEDIDPDAADVTDHSFETVGGSVIDAQPVNGLNSIWELTVQPDGDAAVTVRLPAARDCATPGAACTTDGRQLHNTAEVTVPYEQAEPAEESGATDADSTRDGAIDQGDITDLDTTQYLAYSIDGIDDKVDYFRFNITEPRFVSVGIRQLDADAIVMLEDSDGNEISTKSEPGAEHLMIYGTRLEGTYYIRVEAQQQGENSYKLALGVRDANPDAVRRLRTPPAEQ